MGAQVVLCKIRKQVALCAFCILLASCASTKPLLSDPRSVWCEQNEPIRPSVEVINAMSRAEIDRMNAFNLRGVNWCHWAP